MHPNPDQQLKMTKKSRFKDPHAERESRKYERPIPSRELILKVLSGDQAPMDFDALAASLNLHEDVDLEALRRRARAMERDGQILRNRRGSYLPVDQSDLIRGRVIGHPDGFGFLKPDEGGDDLFMSPKQMRSLMHGDRALVRVAGIDRRGRREGALVEVLERNNEQVVGRLFIESGISFVVADNKRINQDVLIPPENLGGATSGQIVIAAIIEQPSKHSQPIGKIIELLGDHMAPGMEIDIAMRSHNLPHEWPDEVMTEAAGFAPEVSERAKEGRIDLREVPLVTIDGEDARDFDDAVFCERMGKGWLLIVAIADVSAYVNIGNALDQEAHKRATSVYFPGRVIPMLPETLSNGLCSLNPKVDRLCMVCEMHITQGGQLKDFKFYDAVMRSAARLTYDEVAAMVIDHKPVLRKKHAKLVDHLDELYTLFKAMHKQRAKRGAIDFETTETYIEFGKEQKIERIVPRVRNDAHRIIEECMIAANVAAARFLEKKKMPVLYRVHDGPKNEKIEDLRSFLNELGLSLGGGDDPQPKDYAKIMSSIKDRPDAHLIQTVLLRSLSQAIYTPDNEGHFGLAHEAYAHFTSPIRRYPDLLVHRAIRHVLQKNKPSSFEYSHNDMVTNGEHCSMAERQADEATRDAVDWLKCEYMLDKVGESYSGVISSVTSFGLFVELSNIFVEGLVHITSLDNDYYHFDPAGHRLRGERSGQVYRLGDEIRVKVARVDLDERKIDFGLEDAPKARRKKKSAPKKSTTKITGKKKTRAGSNTQKKKKAGTKYRTKAKTTRKKGTGKQRK